MILPFAHQERQDNLSNFSTFFFGQRQEQSHLFKKNTGESKNNKNVETATHIYIFYKEIKCTI